MDILEAVNQGMRRPTQIMYRSNLSFSVVKARLDEMVGNGFLATAQEGARVNYSITQKGTEVLSEFEDVAMKVGCTKGAATNAGSSGDPQYPEVQANASA